METDFENSFINVKQNNGKTCKCYLVNLNIGRHQNNSSTAWNGLGQRHYPNIDVKYLSPLINLTAGSHTLRDKPSFKFNTKSRKHRIALE